MPCSSTTSPIGGGAAWRYEFVCTGLRSQQQPLEAISGGALKAAQRYGQEMGSQEYQNAYNRYNQNRGTRYSMLTGQQAVGQGATNQQGQASQNYGSAAGNAMQNSAAARASGYMGSANALAGGLGQIANNYSQQQMMNRIFGNPASQAQTIQQGWSKWQDPTQYMNNSVSVGP